MESGYAAYSNSPKVALYSERAMEMAYTFFKQDNPTSPEEFLSSFGLEGINSVQKDKFLSIVQQYGEEGFASTINSLEGLSENAKSQLISYSTELDFFLNEGDPSIEDFIVFQTSKIAALNSTELCANDVSLLSFVYNSGIGTARFLYKFKGLDDNISRDCTTWKQKIKCGLLGALVIITVVVIFQWFAALPGTTVIITDGNNNSTTVTGDDAALYGGIIGASLGFVLGRGMYNWCCSWFGALPSCDPTTGSTIRETSCGTFLYREFGPSVYGATTWGPNTNCSPATATTTIPALTFTIPASGSPTTLLGTTSCLSGPTLNLLTLIGMTATLPSGISSFPLLWSVSPPTTYSFTPSDDDLHGNGSNLSAYDNSFEVCVNIPPGGSHTYVWSVNSPFSIIAGGTPTSPCATITIPNETSDDIEISVTCTNTCLNISETIQAVVNHE